MEHLSSSTPEAVAAETITRLLEKYDQAPVLFLVSGGSALTVLEHIDPCVLSRSLTVGMIDERFDSRPTVNNFSQLSALTFFRQCSTAGVSFIDTSVSEGETQDEFAARYEQALKNWRVDNPTGAIIVLLGMGVDGHTAGIMPAHSFVFEGTNAWVVGYEVSGEVSPYTKRATVTPHFLVQEVAAAVVYAVGTDKRLTLEKVLAKETGVDNCPAMIWHQMKELIVVTDS